MPLRSAQAIFAMAYWREYVSQMPDLLKKKGADLLSGNLYCINTNAKNFIHSIRDEMSP